jgi:hypothetical protein
MQEPLTTLLLDDARVIHETTPILPLQAGTVDGHRDTLVLTYRADGFQSPQQSAPKQGPPVSVNHDAASRKTA